MPFYIGVETKEVGIIFCATSDKTILERILGENLFIKRCYFPQLDYDEGVRIASEVLPKEMRNNGPIKSDPFVSKSTNPFNERVYLNSFHTLASKIVDYLA